VVGPEKVRKRERGRDRDRERRRRRARGWEKRREGEGESSGKQLCSPLLPVIANTSIYFSILS